MQFNFVFSFQCLSRHVHCCTTLRTKELDGMSDDRPIHLEGISREGLELFLEHTFGRYVDAIHTVFLTQLFNDL